MDAIIVDSLGEYYENNITQAIGKPLDFGRQFYARLRHALPDDVKLEVWWDHVHAHVEIEAHVGEATLTTIFPEHMAAASRIMFIQQATWFVNNMVAEVGEWRS